MKSNFLLSLISVILCTSSFAQNAFWSDIASSDMLMEPSADMIPTAENQRLLSLNYNALKNTLQAAPLENTSGASSFLLDFPMPDGSFHTMKVVESPLLQPEMAERFPDIKSYSAQSTTDPSFAGRFDLSYNGFNAFFRGPSQGTIYISSLAYNQQTYHAAYYERDIDETANSISSLACGFEPSEENHIHGSIINDIVEFRDEGPVELRVYEMALACTGEYAATHGGTLESVTSSFNTALNTVNAIFEPEVSVRIVLMEGNDVLVFLDAALDPYSNANNGAALLSQNQNVITLEVGIPFTSFDIGHVFTAGCTDVGGIAGGTTCGPAKGAGVTCHSSNNVAAIARRIMAHEIAHQFATAHSWSNCPGNEDQLASGSAYEPGSGTTIMSYVGACGNQNIQFGGDDYYHVGSLEEFITFSRTSSGNECATIEATENSEPILTLNYEDGFYIPIGTPFRLTAEAEDPDGHDIMYCWEQFNLGPQSPLGAPQGNTPTFRSFPPNDSPTRVFPRMPTILSNSTDDVTEVLPTYSREFTFRCTARDNQMGGGGTVWEAVNFEATETAGPFLVASPNDGSEEWMVGDHVEVTWDVANTTNSLVNCQFVNILLSTTGGTSFPIVLAENVLNDGSHFVTVPEASTSAARIQIEAADNIFFDVNDNNFVIAPATVPGYTLDLEPSATIICLPEVAEFEFNSGSILDFDEMISLEIIEGLPAEAIATFSADSISPTESSTLTVEMPGTIPSGLYEVIVQATSASTDTTFRTLSLLVTSNDFSTLSLDTPIDGLASVGFSLDFSWNPTPNADYYEFELATSPSFGASTTETATNITEANYSPQNLFEQSTLYFWRVRPVNSCGPGEYTVPFAFQTSNVSCAPNIATDVPIAISGTGTPTVQSQIFIETDGVISDVNIPILRGSYQPVNSARISLISPEGTEVVLFDQNCGNTVKFDLGFDDDAPSEIACPPDDQIINRPVESLSAFIGENTFGPWTLKTQIVEAGFGGGGGIDAWEIEFCADVLPNSPFLIINDTLFVPPGEINTITTSILEVQDEDNTPEQLTYTLVSAPQNGTVIFAGNFIGQGDTFTQNSINATNIQYLHDGSETLEDSFLFTVTDGTGGWLPTEQFNIVIDEDAVVSTTNLFNDNSIQIYPNPAKEQITVDFRIDIPNRTVLRLFNIYGQEVAGKVIDPIGRRHEINTAQLPAGTYIVRIESENELFTRKVIIQN